MADALYSSTGSLMLIAEVTLNLHVEHLNHAVNTLSKWELNLNPGC